MAAATRKTPPRRPTPTTPTTPQVTPSKDSFLDLLLYALPRFSDLLTTHHRHQEQRREPAPTDVARRRPLAEPCASRPGDQRQQLLCRLSDLATGRRDHHHRHPARPRDVAFRPMSLFPPLLLWLSKVINFSMWLVGLVIPDAAFTHGTVPQWHPTVRPTIWSSATLALAWWVGALGSILISSTQGLFTRSVFR